MLKKCILTFLGFLLALSSLQAEDRPVRLASLDWAPYIGKNLPDQGYIAVIAREAFKRMGHKVEIAFLPWARALEESRKGYYDGLFPEYYSESRKKEYVFSNKFPGGPIGFYKRKESNISYKTLEDLKPYSIGVVRGYINTEAFDKADYLTKDPASSDEINIKKLERLRLDLIVIDKFVAAYIISNKYPAFLDKLEFLEPPLEVKPLYIAFSKQSEGYEKRVKRFNQGLKEIYDDGTMDKILEKYGFK